MFVRTLYLLFFIRNTSRTNHKLVVLPWPRCLHAEQTLGLSCSWVWVRNVQHHPVLPLSFVFRMWTCRLRPGFLSFTVRQDSYAAMNSALWGDGFALQFPWQLLFYSIQAVWDSLCIWKHFSVSQPASLSLDHSACTLFTALSMSTYTSSSLRWIAPQNHNIHSTFYKFILVYMYRHG